ncbi:arabinofuranosyltransferase [Capillimicrobium parvum]|uniref:arabinofuranosyltransferase n=1 Tax=Capillimicrobium parvum TaxID=2884022 RepID=UPI00216AFFC6|nr:arabinofuranosyltransferase [Capillimicrobium parvum]
MLIVAAVGTLALHGVLVALHFRATDEVAPAIGPIWAALMIAIAVAAVLLDRRLAGHLHRRMAVAALAGAATALAMTPLMAGLLGTRQPPFTILRGDMAFRTEAVTRFAATWHLDDYTFRGLHSFYPPAWFWLGGRLANWTGATPWHVVKPLTIGTVGAALLLAFCLWRMVLRPGWALAAAIGSSLVLPTQTEAIAHATEAWYSPYSCLVAICGVAWLAAAWTTVRAPGDRGRLALLAVAGAALALTYDLLFVLLLAVLLALATVSRRERRAALQRAGAVCLGVAVLTAVFWVPLVLAIAGGSAAQGHYVRPDFLRVTTGLGGPVGLTVVVVAAVAALALTLWRPASQAVAALLVATIAYQLASVATLLLAHQQLQPHRAVTMLWATAGAAVAVALPTLGLGRTTIDPRLVAALAVVTVGATFGLGAAQGTTQATGPFTRAAHAPVDLAPSTEMARFITTATARRPQAVTVASTDRALLVTRPFHGFLALGARYAHPDAQVGRRIGVLRAAAACPDPACAARTLARTPFGPVDALVLTRTPAGLRIRTDRDGFPQPVPVTITFRPGLLDRAHWQRHDVGADAVLVRRGAAG